MCLSFLFCWFRGIGEHSSVVSLPRCRCFSTFFRSLRERQLLQYPAPTPAPEEIYVRSGPQSGTGLFFTRPPCAACIFTGDLLPPVRSVAPPSHNFCVFCGVGRLPVICRVLADDLACNAYGWVPALDPTNSVQHCAKQARSCNMERRRRTRRRTRRRGNCSRRVSHHCCEKTKMSNGDSAQD